MTPWRGRRAIVLVLIHLYGGVFIQPCIYTITYHGMFSYLTLDIVGPNIFIRAVHDSPKQLYFNLTMLLRKRHENKPTPNTKEKSSTL